MNEGNANAVWVRVCTLNQLPQTKAVGVSVGGQRLIIARCGDDAYILQGFCSHMLFPLAGSKLNGCVLTCELHQSTFNADGGTVASWATLPTLTGSELGAIHTERGLKTYETRVTDGDVFIHWPGLNSENVPVVLKL